MSACAGAAGDGSGVSGGAMLYRVMAYIREFRTGESVEVYEGRDREIALAYVRSYASSGTYVHLIERKEKD